MPFGFKPGSRPLRVAGSTGRIWGAGMRVPGDNHGRRIAVLVVAYNALTTLSQVLKRIPKDVWSNIEEVAVFDDASKDETYELAVGYKTLFGDGKLNIMRNEKNLGYGGNQKRGYRYLIEKGYDVVIMLHGDGQYAPEFLAHLYRPLVMGEADAVFGSRMLRDFGGPLRGGMPLYKYVGNKVLTRYANHALEMNLTEFHSGYRAYSLAALREIDFSQMTDDFHFDTQIIIKLHHQNFRICEVPIPTYYGGEICYVNGIKYAKNVFHAVRRYRRTLGGLADFPEYAEYKVHYPLKKSGFSSHDFCQRLVGSGKDVLDVGCGEGFLAAEIQKCGNRVVGVGELSEPKCRTALCRYFSLNLENGLAEVANELGPQSFDVVLFQDVLEHLRDPQRVLSACTGLLRRDGRVLVSVPNVANITVRLELLMGRFQYRPRGILDETHVRFYTRRTARQLLEQNGLTVLEEKATVIPVELALGISPRSILMRLAIRALAGLTALLPGLLGYQIILVARPKSMGSDQSASCVGDPDRIAA
jgi:2-polyprenyl-3-methyl-5-hydroxy-6-metoxy-1,4-benzoquinol methylase